MKINIYKLYFKEKLYHFDGECEWYGYSDEYETRFQFSNKEEAEYLAKALMAKEEDYIYEVKCEVLELYDTYEDAFKDPYISRVLNK